MQSLSVPIVFLKKKMLIDSKRIDNISKWSLICIRKSLREAQSSSQRLIEEMEWAHLELYLPNYLTKWVLMTTSSAYACLEVSQSIITLKSLFRNSTTTMVKNIKSSLYLAMTQKISFNWPTIGQSSSKTMICSPSSRTLTPQIFPLRISLAFSRLRHIRTW